MIKRLGAVGWLLCVCSLSVLLLSCSKKEETPAENRPSASSPQKPGAWAPLSGPFHDLRDVPGTVFDVAYTPNTVRVDLETARRTLKSISSDGDIFVFDDSDARLGSLAEGQVLFLENLAVRKVVAVAKKDSQIVVGTERAGLADLVEKGTIQWKVPIRFSALSARYRNDGLDADRPQWALWLSPERVYAGSGGELSFSGKIDGWNVSFDSKPSPNRLDMKFHVDKNLDELIVDLTAKGYLKDFFSAANMHVQDGSVDNFAFSNTSLNGEMNVDWTAMRGEGKTAGMDKPNIKLPPIAKIPMPVGGIPFVVTVNANLILKPGFGGKKETAKGGFKITYDGEEGIKVTNGQAVGSGSVTGDGSIGSVESFSLAPHAVLIGMAAPKITLSLGTDSTVDLLTSALPSSVADTLSDFLSKSSFGKYVKKKAESSFKTNASASVQSIAIYTLVTAGTMGMFPCKVSKLSVSCKAGADAYMLGKKVGDKEVVLAQKDFVIREPNIKACEQ